MYIFYNTNRDHNQLFNCLYTKHVTRVLFLNAGPELYFTLYIIFTLKSSYLWHIQFKALKNTCKMHLLSLLLIKLHMHRVCFNICWLLAYPYILFRWRNIVLALHRKWSHQYAHRWRTVRFWFQGDYVPLLCLTIALCTIWYSNEDFGHFVVRYFIYSTILNV